VADIGTRHAAQPSSVLGCISHARHERQCAVGYGSAQSAIFIVRPLRDARHTWVRAPRSDQWSVIQAALQGGAGDLATDAPEAVLASLARAGIGFSCAAGTAKVVVTTSTSKGSGRKDWLLSS